ncbi:EamA family transporter [Methylobacterium organophilum]|nr:EamA family transporter [Methylobacterium organophilum]
MQTADLRKGYLLGLATFSIWGMFPLYFKALEQYGALEIVTQRVIWSAVFGSLVLLVWRHPGWWRELLAHPRRLGVLGISSVLIAANWLIYVWAVNHDRMVEASLGYYINPLVNVLLGMIVLRERLRPLQWLAVHVEDHPLEYATFEGHIPEGHYGAGDVIVWDRGVWKPQGDPQEGYRKGKLKFSLEGEKLAGSWNLVRTRMDGKKEQWFLIKSRDEAAREEGDYDIVAAEPDSVLSDRTLVPRKRGAAKARIAESPAKPVKAPAKKRQTGQQKAAVTLEGAVPAELPESFKPQLATLVDSVPAGDWRYEIKFDGYRMLARIDSGEVRLFTRNGHDWTAKMPQQAAALAGHLGEFDPDRFDRIAALG